MSVVDRAIRVDHIRRAIGIIVRRRIADRFALTSIEIMIRTEIIPVRLSSLVLIGVTGRMVGIVIAID